MESESWQWRSCFNAFSRVDIRVDVKIPGGVNAYVIDLRGERCATVSTRKCVLTRLPDMKQHQRCGKRHMFLPFFAPFYTRTTQPTFLMHTGSSIQLHPARENSDFSRQRNYYFQKVVILLFCHLSEAFTCRIGWQVGSDPEIQVATVVSNHLTAGIMKYFGDSGRYQQVANLYEKLVVKEPEVSSLLARSYIGMSACLVMTCLNSFFNATIF